MATWQQLSRWGIQKGDGRAGDNAAAYTAGKLDDVLRIPDPTQNTVLAASQSSGVWIVDPDGGAALSLSHDWTRAGMSSLSTGVFGVLHIYAGGESLMETDTTQPDPLQSWVPVVDSAGSTVLADAGAIMDVVVVKNPNPQFGNLLVLACTTGVIFSQIPSSAGGGYDFKTTTFPAVAFGSMVEGPNGNIVAATLTQSPSTGIYLGTWSNSQTTGLTLTPSISQWPTWYDAAQTVPFDPTILGRISIDSCENVRGQIYAIAEMLNPIVLQPKNISVNNMLHSVLKSDLSITGPLRFSVTGDVVLNSLTPLFGLTPTTAGLAGNAGNINQGIGVSPTFPDWVVFGWRDGYFFSGNGGVSWTMAPGPSDPLDLNYHSDYHATRFDPYDPSQRMLYICSDGGLNITTNFGEASLTVSTLANRRLPNLLVTQTALNATNSGTCSCSLQDNAGVASTLYPLDSKPYRVNLTDDQFGNDGRVMIMLPNDQLLYTSGESANPIDMVWDSVSERDLVNPPTSATGVLPLDVNPATGRDPQGLTSMAIFDSPLRFLVDQKMLNPICSIAASNYQNPAKETMVAIAVASTNVTNTQPPQTITAGNWVYGLFIKQDANLATNTGHWTPLNQITLNGTEEITAIGTFDGTIVFVGTSQGRILALTSDTTLPWAPRFVSDLTPLKPQHRIVGFAFEGTASGIAITDRQTIWQTARDADNSLVWTLLPGPPDWNSQGASYSGGTAIVFQANSAGRRAYFVSNYTDVFMRAQGVEGSFEWTTLTGPTTGLPLWPRCMDISVLTEDTGAEYVYVSTYGFGVWRLLLNSPPTIPTDVFINGSMGIASGSTKSFLIVPQKFSLDSLTPYAEFEVVNEAGNLSAQLFVFMRLRPGRQVDVEFHVIFRNSGPISDPRRGAFTLVPGSVAGGGRQHTNAESGDASMDVDFDVSI